MSTLKILALLGLAFLTSNAVGQEAREASSNNRVLQEEFRSSSLNGLELARKKALLMGWPLRLELEDGSYSELQGLDNGTPIYYKTENRVAAATTSTHLVHPNGGSGLNLSGAGMTIGLWDGGGVRTTHQEYVGRVIQKDVPTSVQWHATHVAGTLIAAGVVNNAKGMAFEANLSAYDWVLDNNEMIAEAAAGMLISNHSYGQIGGWAMGNWSGGANQWHWFGFPHLSQTEARDFGMYNVKAAQWDAIAFNNPYYLIVKSAGNDRGEGPVGVVTHKAFAPSGIWTDFTAERPSDCGATGYDCIPTNGCSKNILTVGAVNDIPNGYQNPSNVVAAPFTSFGPTDDGRIKPDLVGNGVAVYSSHSNTNTAYSTSSGTSMSSPNVAGSLLLVQQHYHNLNQTYMLSSMLKGLAIHTADESGDDVGPDYKFGWGLLNTKKAVDAISDTSRFKLLSTTLLQNQVHTYSMYSDGVNPLRATICWTDTAGAFATNTYNDRTVRLRNDLDLRIKPVGCDTSFFPWKLDPLFPANAAFRGDNIVDNVEMVSDIVLPKGYYTAVVRHKGNLVGGKQQYSIILESAPEEEDIEDVLTYQQAPVEVDIPSAWNLTDVEISLEQSTDVIEYAYNEAEDKLIITGLEVGFDTLTIISCSEQLAPCSVCDTLNIFVEVRPCSENVSGGSGAAVVEAVASCVDEEGWWYYMDPVTFKTLLALKPKSNVFEPELVQIDASNVGSFVSTASGNAMQLHPRMITIVAPGEYPLDGGVGLRLFYNNEDVEEIKNNYLYSRWIKFSGDKQELLQGFLAPGFDYTPLGIVSEGVEDDMYFVEFDNITSFSTFAIMGSDAASILPVTWLSFEANISDNNNVSLLWSTASELNNKGFEVQYSSDATNFRKIGFVEGNGTTSLPQSYSFAHNNVDKGNHYYRLKQIDFDEQFEYSAIRTVSIDVAPSLTLSVAPNPSAGVYVIEGNQPLGTVRVFSSSGNLVTSFERVDLKQEIDITNYPAGVYYLLTDKGYFKLVKTI